MNYFSYVYAMDDIGSKIEQVKPVVPHEKKAKAPIKPQPEKPDGAGRHGLKHPDGTPCDAKTRESCPLNKQKKLPEWYDQKASAGIKKAYDDVLEKGYFVSSNPQAQSAWAKALNGNLWAGKRQPDGSVHFYPKGGDYEKKMASAKQNVETSEEARRQYDDVVSKYKGTSSWMRAPNGKPTRLTERQWVQCMTENFKKWFGDWECDPKNASKVVDENGEPRVVYHGTNVEFNEFDPSHQALFIMGNGFYFSGSKATAESYAKGKSGSRIIEAFLNIRNPSMNYSTDDGCDGLANKYTDLYVAVRPNQVKSANANGGDFSQASDFRR